MGDKCHSSLWYVSTGNNVKVFFLTNTIAVAIIYEVDIYMMKIDIKEADKKPGLAVPFLFSVSAEELGAVHEDYTFEGSIEVCTTFQAQTTTISVAYII